MTGLPTKPSEVVTTEQEIMRLMMFYRDSNPKTSWLEESNFTMPVCSWDWKPNPEGRLLFVARATVEVNSALIVTGIKPWMAAIETPGGATLSGNSYTS